MRAVHITTSHRRNDQRILQKECRSLARAGHEVTLVVFDNQGESSKDGVTIVDLGSATTGRLHRFLIRPPRAFIYALRNPVDIFHFHDPEMLLVAAVLKMTGLRVIFDLHEDYGFQLATRIGIPQWIRKMLARAWPSLERLLMRKLDALIVPQTDMQEKFGKINAATFLVPNFVELDYLSRSFQKNRSERKLIVYVGAISEARGLGNLAGLMHHADPDWLLVLAGKVEPPHMLDTFKNHSRAAQIEYRGVISPEEVAALLQQATIGLIPYNNVGQYGTYSWATKIFEYMRFGLPVVMPNFGAWLAFNEAHNCGVCVDPRNAAAVADAIRDLISNQRRAEALGSNGLRSVQEKYHWGVAERALFQAYESAVSSSK